MWFAISKPQALLCLLCSQWSWVSQWEPSPEHHPRRLCRRKPSWLLWSWCSLHTGVGRHREDGQLWQQIPEFFLPLFQGAIPCLKCCSERFLKIRGKCNNQLKQTQGHHDAITTKNAVYFLCSHPERGKCFKYSNKPPIKWVFTCVTGSSVVGMLWQRKGDGDYWSGECQGCPFQQWPHLSLAWPKQVAMMNLHFCHGSVPWHICKSCLEFLCWKMFQVPVIRAGLGPSPCPSGKKFCWLHCMVHWANVRLQGL